MGKAYLPWRRASRRELLFGAAALAVAPRGFGQPRIFTLHVVPLGPVEQEYLDTAASALRARLKVEVRLSPSLPLPSEAFYAPRKRYRAEKLLDALEAQGPKEAWKVVGVTHAEISTTKGDIFDWGIAGLGLLGGKVCVLSTHLYLKHSRSKPVLHRRLADVTVHEFGHTLGLPHCEVKGCVMADAKGKAIASADQSTGHYCPTCRRLAEWGPLVLADSPVGGGDGAQGAGALPQREARDAGQQ